MPERAKEGDVMAVDTKGGGITGFVKKFWDEIIGGFILYKTGQAAGGGQGQAGGSWLSGFMLTFFPSMTDEDDRLWADLTSVKDVADQKRILTFVEKIKKSDFDEKIFILRLVKIFKEWKDKNKSDLPNSADKILSDIIFLDKEGVDVQMEFCRGKKLLIKKSFFRKAFQNKFVAICYGVTAIIFFGYVFSVMFE